MNGRAKIMIVLGGALIICMFVSGLLMPPNNRAAVPKDGAEPTLNLTVEVDYDVPFDQAVTVGEFNQVDLYLTAKRFGQEAGTGKQQVVFKLFQFESGPKRSATPLPEALSAIKQEGYRPATLRELLAFARANPEAQRHFRIASFGAIGHGRSELIACPELWSEGDLPEDRTHRILTLYYFGAFVREDYSLLAVQAKE